MKLQHQIPRQESEVLHFLLSTIPKQENRLFALAKARYLFPILQEKKFFSRRRQRYNRLFKRYRN
ncbi:hypothetical protein LMANV2_580012 [Leptospira interrogans serovar Manilae]|uniref:Uncharacterized protein n=1 Tax=Leptospira interrogans serovar Manilae TaxID=214675 RepID=A0AAQ1P0T0_LEPIR|nr:hypothetical protein LMANV2_580012 [Leptospira interrogans serovar Manilae]